MFQGGSAAPEEPREPLPPLESLRKCPKCGSFDFWKATDKRKKRVCQRILPWKPNKNGSVDPVQASWGTKTSFCIFGTETFQKDLSSVVNMQSFLVGLCEAVGLVTRTGFFSRCIFLMQPTRVLFRKKYCALTFPRCNIHRGQDELYLKKKTMQTVSAFQLTLLAFYDAFSAAYLLQTSVWQ